MAADEAELERRINAGIGLRPTEAARLLGVSRSTISNWLASGKIRHTKRGGGIQRICNPEDIRTLLAEARRERRGTDEAPSD